MTYTSEELQLLNKIEDVKSVSRSENGVIGSNAKRYIFKLEQKRAKLKRERVL